VQGSWDDPIMLPDAQSLISRSNAAAPLLDAVRDRKTREGLAAATEPAAKRYAAQVQIGESPWNTIDRTRVDAATIEKTPAPARLIEPVLKAAVVLVIGVDLKVVASMDAELDRVGDLELLSDKFKGLRDGRPIAVGWMNGRSRAYEVTMPRAAPRTALAIGFNDKCDVVVATVVADDVPAAERAALAFLNGDLVRRWVEKELGL